MNDPNTSVWVGQLRGLHAWKPVRAACNPRKFIHGADRNVCDYTKHKTTNHSNDYAPKGQLTGP